jgi:hypothetical protein
MGELILSDFKKHLKIHKDINYFDKPGIITLLFKIIILNTKSNCNRAIVCPARRRIESKHI